MMKAQFEVDYCINAFRAAAGVPRRLTGQTMPLDRPGAFGMSVREPVGVIACITPFNVPLLKNVKQIAMVIATGNTAVLLPSEFASQVTVKFAETLAEAGTPAGVFNYVTGDPFEIGDCPDQPRRTLRRSIFAVRRGSANTSPSWRLKTSSQ